MIKEIDEDIIGTVTEIKNYYAEELTKQAFDTEINLEDFKTNAELIKELFDSLENEDKNKKIIVKFNPMGSLYYEEYKNTTTVENLSREDLLFLIKEYNDYVLNFFEEHENGMLPVSIYEFSTCEFQNILESEEIK